MKKEQTNVDLYERMHEWMNERTKKQSPNWKLIIVLSVEKVVMLRKSSVQSHWESTARVFYIENVEIKTGRQQNTNHHHRH